MEWHRGCERLQISSDGSGRCESLCILGWTGISEGNWGEPDKDIIIY